VVPGPDFGLHAFASLTALGLPEARAAADELVAAGLLHESGHGRYGVHDLVRIYAREQLPSGPGRDSAPLTRLLDHYLHTAHAAELLLSPKREPLTLPATATGVVVQDLPDGDAATAWFTAELPAPVATVGAAGAAGRDAHAHQLVWTLATFCGHRGRWREWVLAQHVAVASARHCGGRRGSGRGVEAARTGLLHRPSVRAGLTGRAHVHFDLALLMDRQGRPAEAAPYAQRSLEDFGAAGNDHGVAVALNAVGWYHCELGDLHEMGDRTSSAIALDHLGDSYEAAGDVMRARLTWREALAEFEDVSHPEADQVRRKLLAPVEL
jgi:hypothetical protein